MSGGGRSHFARVVSGEPRERFSKFHLVPIAEGELLRLIIEIHKTDLRYEFAVFKSWKCVVAWSRVMRACFFEGTSILSLVCFDIEKG